MSRQKLIISVSVAFVLTWLLTNRWGNDWEVPVRRGLFQVFADSAPQFSVPQTQRDGVPRVFMAPENGIAPGLQYNPTIVGNFALDYFQAFEKTGDSATFRKFMNCARSLQDSLTQIPAGALYRFLWQQPWYPEVPAPFTSGMSSGRALEVFSQAFAATQDSSFYHSGQQLIKGYFLPIDSGGFTIQEPSGWWYEMVAAPRVETPRVLDGHMFALAGLFAFNNQFQHDSASYLLDKGLAALKTALPRYDSPDGKFLYDKYGKIADKNYRKHVLNHLQHFYQETGDEVFNAYYKKWVKRDKWPFVYRFIRVRNISAAILFAGLFIIFTGLIYLVLIIWSSWRKPGSVK